MSIDLQITRLAEPDVTAASAIQARAFFDDPAFTFTLPDESTRSEPLRWLMGIALGYGTRYGRVDTTAGEMLGHAVWLPPDASAISEERMAELGMMEGPQRMGEEAFQRFGSFMDRMSEHHQRILPDPHWYLMVLGVEPSRQGQGIGTLLIAPMLAHADAEDLPCYLETAKERNVGFYRRHGFEVRLEDDIPGGGPRIWMMVRERRSRRQ